MLSDTLMSSSAGCGSRFGPRNRAAEVLKLSSHPSRFLPPLASDVMLTVSNTLRRTRWHPSMQPNRINCILVTRFHPYWMGSLSPSTPKLTSHACHWKAGPLFTLLSLFLALCLRHAPHHTFRGFYWWALFIFIIFFCSSFSQTRCYCFYYRSRLE